MSTVKARVGYADVRTEVERPLDERRKMLKGRDGDRVIPRKFHLTTAELDQLAAEHRDGNKLPNPHNKGTYFYIIEALKKLGLVRRHSIAEVKATMRELMEDKSTIQTDGKGNKTNAWQRFNRKEARNAETGRDADGRILQNVEVLQRVNMNTVTPYGYKLLQIGQKILKTSGCVIDLTLCGEDNKEIFLALNTDSATPINQRKRARKTAVVAAKPKAKPKKASKPKAKAKSKTRKASPKKATPDLGDPGEASGHNDANVTAQSEAASA
jgi:hypothetical protein